MTSLMKLLIIFFLEWMVYQLVQLCILTAFPAELPKEQFKLPLDKANTLAIDSSSDTVMPIDQD